MKLYYAGLVLACMSTALVAHSKVIVKKPNYLSKELIQRANTQDWKNDKGVDFCDTAVSEIKDILTNKNLTNTEKVSKIRTLAESKFNIHQITMKATSQIRKKHKMSDTKLSELKSAIMTYLYNKYVNLTSDYTGTSVTISRKSTTGNKRLQKFNYVIQTGRKTLPVSVFVQNNKITDVIFNNVSLVVPNSFAWKLDNEFKGNIAEFTNWLNQPRTR